MGTTVPASHPLARSRQHHPDLQPGLPEPNSGPGGFPFEVRRINLDLFDHTRRAQAHQYPIIPRFAAAAGFPAIAHVHPSPVGQDHPGVAVVRIIKAGNPPTVNDRRKFGEVFSSIRLQSGSGSP